jgi:PAS domain-containing protein
MDLSTHGHSNRYGRQLQDRLGAALHRLASLEESASGQEPRRTGERLNLETLRRLNADLQRALIEVEEAAASYEHLRSSAAHAAWRADLLFVVSPVPYVVLERSGAVVDANPAAAQKLNLSHRHLVGKPFELFVGSDRANFVKRLGSLDSGEWVTKWPLTIRPRERGSLHVIFAASVDSDDHILAMLLPSDAHGHDSAVALERAEARTA